MASNKVFFCGGSTYGATRGMHLLILSSPYVTISESFKRLQYFNFETNFPENEILFQKT